MTAITAPVQLVQDLCKWCGDEFDSDSDRVRLRHRHLVFRRPMRADVTGQVHRVSGALCCRCRNIERAHVRDEIRKNEPVIETDKVTYYPTGNWELVVSEPGVSTVVRG